MNIRNFVSGSSVILVAWLGATFISEVPTQRYPKLDESTTAQQELPDATYTSAPSPALVSASR